MGSAPIYILLGDGDRKDGLPILANAYGRRGGDTMDGECSPSL